MVNKSEVAAIFLQHDDIARVDDGYYGSNFFSGLYQPAPAHEKLEQF